MDKNPEDIAQSGAAAEAAPSAKDNVLQSGSNLKSGKDLGSSEKLSQPLDQIGDSEEDLLLCLTSDTEVFEESAGVKEGAKKTAGDGKSDKYFEDIESSDNSQEYELKACEKEKIVEIKDEEEKKVDRDGKVEEQKETEAGAELELEPVESDEEEFDENLSQKTGEGSKVEGDRKVKGVEPVEILKDLEAVSDSEDLLTLAEKSETADVEVDREHGKDEGNDVVHQIEKKPDPEGVESCKDTAAEEEPSAEEGNEAPKVKESVQLELEKESKDHGGGEEKPVTDDAESSAHIKKEVEDDEESVPEAEEMDKTKKDEDDNKGAKKAEESKQNESEIAAESSDKAADKKDMEDDLLETTKGLEGPKDSSDKDTPKQGDQSESEKPVEKASSSTEGKEKEAESRKASGDPTDPDSKLVAKVKSPESKNTSRETSEETVAPESKTGEQAKTAESNPTPSETSEETVAVDVETVSKKTEASLEENSACVTKEKDLLHEEVPINKESDLKESEKEKHTTESVSIESSTVTAEAEAETEKNQEQKDNETKVESKFSEEPKEKVTVEPTQPLTVDSEGNSNEEKAELETAEPEPMQTEEEAQPQISSQSAAEPKAIDSTSIPPLPTEDTADRNTSILSTKVSELMTTMDTSSLQGLTSDDDESLLVIDTTHKDDNENEDNDVDTETEQTAATDSSSDGSLEIFYHKECSNYDCSHGSKNFYRAPLFALNYYKVSKKQYKPQFVCEDCYDNALHAYEEMCVILKQKQPLYGASFKRQDFVEIIDSSDEEDTDGNADSCKDEGTFPKESIEFLENELEGIIRDVMQSVDIQNQLSWTKQVLQQNLDRVKEEASFVSDQLQQLQKKADKMHNSLYQCPSIKIRQLTPLDLNSGRSYSPESESTIPAIGDIERPAIQLNETYYAVKNKAIASWVPCKVVEEVEDSTSQTKNLKHFKIKFLKSKYPMLKTLSAKHMAYFDPPKVRLPIGTRVIAYFDASSLSRGKEKMLIPSAFYPGIIAEPLKMSNKFRYLVFYDDGYFQYVSYKDVRLVCYASECVWDDVHHQSRDFIQNYLTQYAVNRPMVQTQKGQCMLVDYNGKWVYARVVDVDCSLVQMMFEGQSRSEWIYRGSTRLGPVYKESNNIAPKTSWNQSRISRRTEPFIRYFNDEDSSSSQPNAQAQQLQSKSGEVRSVAKKSVSRSDAAGASQPVPVVKHLNNSTIFVDDDNKPKGKVVYYTARKNLPPRDFVPHRCGPSCPFVITHNLQFYSPLAKPLLSGWERQVFRQKSKKFIVYRGPCGKRLRSMDELHRYLRMTNNELNVDNFDFSPETNCLAEYVIESCIVQKKDISNGEERMPIPCVNYYDNTMPPDCKYSSRRIPTEGVHLNLDPDFLVGCDCEDDCSDKSKCSCWQLTYAGAKYSMPNVPHEMVGYQYKRLYAHVPTGIYECNSRCKCKANCVNRVVQQSLQSKLQVFKTSNRGWGLRCINDVPRGSFICIYAGHLLTEQKANEGGLDAGDEYFAELDYIEVAEQIKEGYESDVAEPDDEEEMYNPDKDDDDDEFIAPGDPYRNKSISTRLSTRRSTKNSSDAEHDSQERQVISFEPDKSQERPSSVTERPTMRRLFGKDEGTYIMDAKVTGNLGRYFNHSCSPNLFVQNVFVDTHDLRFPWVAFFAFSHIRAGTELTWNYNYEVGVVPGKVLYCQCGAPNCRQRLL